MEPLSRQLVLVEDDPVQPVLVEQSAVKDEQLFTPSDGVSAQSTTSNRPIGGATPKSSFTSRATARVGTSPCSMYPPGISR
ncbi:hypothetical protein HNR07_001029 [Nocardiopsis metallicus]|uniref:Uncharacterized protein n=1 Tax=Nocardiopsis metallicus TaxID=179819 RepID=A0A840W1E2_9ACTN|nr:hypothetical protein [Nocardiopsis metallicus]